ncbi:MAG: hypothetical protein HYX78_05305 [Armatimonadetes bacterium]|nr:hypothetical protein [Armatimonadota bacterium]
MEETRSDGGGGFAGWRRLAYGAAVGAVVAAVLGFGLSAALSTVRLALIMPAEGARPDFGAFLARSGLNFLAIHHIRIIGEALPGGPGQTGVSIMWPLTIWAAVPAFALAVGGYARARLSGLSRANFFAGASVAFPYTIILLVIRPVFSMPSVSIKLPEIAGTGVAPESVPALLSAAFVSTLLHGLLFGIVFGSVGALGGLRVIRNALFGGDGFVPSWMRGAVAAVFAGEIVFLVLVLAASGLAGGEERRAETLRSWITISPAVAGNILYLAHGVTLRGQLVTRVGIPEARPNVRTYRAGLITGIQSEGRKSRMPGWAYAAFLVPALALIFGGFLAGKTASASLGRLALAAGYAGMYALLLTALVSFSTLALRTEIRAGAITTTTTAVLGPSAAQTFALSLVAAFVFGLIGIGITQRNDHP